MSLVLFLRQNFCMDHEEGHSDVVWMNQAEGRPLSSPMTAGVQQHGNIFQFTRWVGVNVIHTSQGEGSPHSGKVAFRQLWANGHIRFSKRFFGYVAGHLSESFAALLVQSRWFSSHLQQWYVAPNWQLAMVSGGSLFSWSVIRYNSLLFPVPGGFKNIGSSVFERLIRCTNPLPQVVWAGNLINNCSSFSLMKRASWRKRSEGRSVLSSSSRFISLG